MNNMIERAFEHSKLAALLPGAVFMVAGDRGMAAPDGRRPPSAHEKQPKYKARTIG
jgi:hypothetical protein